MACKGRLSVAQIRSLKPQDRRFEILDGAGLYLEVMPTGSCNWRYRYAVGNRRRRINLGKWPSLSLSYARAARDHVAEAINQGSPAALLVPGSRTRMKAITLRGFAARYMQERVAKLRKAPKYVQRYLDRDILPILGEKNLAAITATDIRELVFARRDSGRPQSAVAVRNLLKRIFDYAVICGVATSNPTAAIPNKFIAKAKARDRALGEEEIREFLHRLASADIPIRFKIALKLILLTLVRKGELRTARWEHFYLYRGEWEIPPESSKTGKGQIVYLSRQAVELFRRLSPSAGCILPNASSSTRLVPIAPGTLNRALKQISKGMAHFTVHDLRRTAATRLSEMHFNPDAIEKALNHTIKGVRGIYNRAQYEDERRTMLQAWADYLDGLEPTFGGGLLKS